MCRTRGVRLAVVEGYGCKVGYDFFCNYPNQDNPIKREFDGNCKYSIHEKFVVDS